jgi:hypothetical protein
MFISIPVERNANGSPRTIYVGDVWHDTIGEAEFYDIMSTDKEWAHSDTFLCDVREDTHTPCMWKVEAHDLSGWKGRWSVWHRIVYVIAERGAHWK